MCLIGRDRSDDPPFRKTTVVYEEPVRTTTYTTTSGRRASYVSDRDHYVARSSYVSDHQRDRDRHGRSSYVSDHHGGSGSRRSSRYREVYLERDPARISATYARRSNPIVVERRSGPVAVVKETRRII